MLREHPRLKVPYAKRWEFLARVVGGRAAPRDSVFMADLPSP